MEILRKIRNGINNRYLNFIKFHYPFYWAKLLYYNQLGKKANFKCPKDLNEKIQWLEFYTDTSLWTTLADKYRVRDFVKKLVGDEILIPLIGVWEDVNKIDFNQFPNKFVIKPNNGSYDTHIVPDKNSADLGIIKKKLIYSLNKKFGYDNAEPHYLNIKPCIIAEELLDTQDELGLVDYKIWCFNGIPNCIFVCFNRNPENHHAEFMVYDLSWKKLPDMLTEEFRSNCDCPCPTNLDKMLEIASLLSKGLPQCRVDLYNIEGKIYFGEMTLTSNYGMMPYFTQQALNNLGNQCILPKPRLFETIKCFFNRNFPRL